jgi:bifunctional non-homologous end joining protein LigD
LLERFPEMAKVGDSFTDRPILIDGEIVALDEQGRSSFQCLQRARAAPQNLRYAVFDALFADGRDLREERLDERKRTLESIVRTGDPLVVYSQHVVGQGKELFAFARERGLEGIIGKRRDAPYGERRTRDWVKIKVKLSQECVIGGYTDPGGARKGFGSLVCGAYEDGELRYVGHVGTGFDSKTIALLYARLRKLATDESPFDERVPRRSGTHWVRPELVAQVEFSEWTADGRMRQPTFQGLREDKRASEVVRERAVPFRPVRDVRSKR